MKKIILAILILAVCGYFFGSNYVKKSLEAVDLTNDLIYTIEIPAGSTTSKIAKILYENKLIKNMNIFKYYSKKSSSDGKLKAGIYNLAQNMDADSIIKELKKGGESTNTVNITIIEGLTIEETAETIASQVENINYEKLIKAINNIDLYKEKYDFIKENPNIKSLQGYLMPDTYNIYTSSSESDIIERLLLEFDNFYKNEIKHLLKNSELSFEDIINLASIVEKEALVDNERDKVAKVFLNRLDINMKLQSCATVNYARGEWKERLTYDDIAIDSPFNTYVNAGLPPTAINSPGRVSILAVLNPADVDYLFFVAKGDGTHYFSKNYDDHIKAAGEYLN